MSASPKARAGIPISAKLILTTSVVVAVAVGVATWFSQRSIDDLTASHIVARRTSGEKAIVRESELATQTVAKTVANAFATNMTGEVAPVLDAALHEDKVNGENRLEWLMIVSDDGKAIACSASQHAPAKCDVNDAVVAGAPTQAKLPELQKLLAAGAKTGDVSHARIGDSSDWVYGMPLMSGDHKVGAILSGVTTAGLDAELSRSLAEADEHARASRQKLLLVTMAVLLIGVLAAALQGVSLARPIKVLTVQANKIAGGDLETRVPEGRNDELGVLARTFNYMSDAMVHLLAANAEKASLEKEMELARQVQQAMLPPTALDQHGYVKVVGYCMPASQCGGDWWMYRKLSNGRMLLIVGDATGHGIHSAMIAATARGAVEALAAVDERLLTPDQVLRAIDQAIAMVGEHNVLMTAFAAVFDSQAGMLHYANAGQNFPYVIKLGQTRLLEEASIIAASGNPLGDRNIQVEIRRGSLQLRPGDLFVCFTDGVVERANPAGKLFGDRRLRGALAGQALPDGNALVQLRDHVLDVLERHAEGAVAEDDITFVLCQFDPPARASRISGSGRGAA